MFSVTLLDSLVARHVRRSTPVSPSGFGSWLASRTNMQYSSGVGGSSGHGFHTRLFAPFAFFIWLTAYPRWLSTARRVMNISRCATSVSNAGVAVMTQSSGR